MKQTNFISCVVYLHNKEKEIIPFMRMLLDNVLRKNFENYEIICVNDFSDDATVERLKEFIRKQDTPEAVSLINMSYYQGQEAAMNAGRDLAVGDYIFEFDSIEQDYEETLICELYERALEGYDIVSAVPKNHVSLSSRLFYCIYNWASKAPGKLQQERFRIISRRAVNRIHQMNTYVPYRKAMYVKCGLQMDFILYESRHKAGRGRSAQEKNSRSGLAFDSFIIFTDVVERISFVLCLFFLLVMIGMVFYVIWSIFSEVRPVEGWMSTVGLMSFGFFGIFLLLTLILKYLSVILNLLFRKQRYLISGIEKLTK